jgi:hypothetical protein
MFLSSKKTMIGKTASHDAPTRAQQAPGAESQFKKGQR